MIKHGLEINFDAQRDSELENTLANSVRVFVFDEVDSTQNVAKSMSRILLKNENSLPILVLANSQKAGRGRSQRTWSSPAGQGLYFTYGDLRKIAEKDLSGLSPAIGLAVLKGLRQHLPADIRSKVLLKWPNDLVYLEDTRLRKLAGVLIEAFNLVDESESSSSGRAEGIVLVGVGVNLSGLIPELGIKHTSLEKLGCKTYSAKEILVSLAKSLELSIAQFREFGFEAFRDEWNSNSVHYGDEIKLSLDGFTGEAFGKVEGINSDGSLSLRTRDGELKAIYSGDLPFSVEDPAENSADSSVDPLRKKVSGRIVSGYCKLK